MKCANCQKEIKLYFLAVKSVVNGKNVYWKVCKQCERKKYEEAYEGLNVKKEGS